MDVLQSGNPRWQAEFESDAERGHDMATDVAAEAYGRSADARLGAMWTRARCSSALPRKHRSAADVAASLLCSSSSARRHSRDDDYRSSINDYRSSINHETRF